MLHLTNPLLPPLIVPTDLLIIDLEGLGLRAHEDKVGVRTNIDLNQPGLNWKMPTVGAAIAVIALWQMVRSMRR